MISSRNAFRRIARVPIRMRSAVTSIGSVTVDAVLALGERAQERQALDPAGARAPAPAR